MGQITLLAEDAECFVTVLMMVPENLTPGFNCLRLVKLAGALSNLL